MDRDPVGRLAGTILRAKGDRMIKPIRFLTTVECAEGGSIGIYESEGGLPIIRTYDAITGHVVNAEIRGTQELTTLRKALNEFYGGLRGEFVECVAPLEGEG